MFQRGRPQFHSLQKGKLIPRQSSNQLQGHSIVCYKHTLRETPDQYHTWAIKQYRKQLDEIRKNYEQLKRAYYLLLGYKFQGSEQIPKSLLLKDKNHLCVTEVSQQNERSSHLVSSAIEVTSALSDIQQNRKRMDKLAQSIIEFGDKIPFREKVQTDIKIGKSVKNNKIKTEYDQCDQQVEEQLLSAFRQIQRLKNNLESTTCKNQVEVRQYKQSYQEHIRKLEQILERERRHTRMLNGVITRTRNEMECKDNLIRSIMKLKNTDKSTVEKLMRQFRINL